MVASALPKQVREAAARAESILAEMNKPPEDKKPPETPPNPETPPKAEPHVQESGASKKDEQGAEMNTPPKAETPPAPDGEKPWEQKYKVLQGKYNAEVPRLQKQLGDAQELIQEMRQRQNNLETMLATIQTKQTPSAPVEPKKPVISDEEVETYGADLVDLIRRAAREEAERMVAAGTKPLADKIGKVEQSTSQVSQNVAKSKQQQTIDALANALPDWERQNQDAGFLEWLDQRDPFAGQKRGVLLTQAFQANDAQRVIAIFQGYRNENAAVQPEPSSNAPETPPAPPEPQTRMEEMVAPGAPKAPTASAPNEAGKRVWTQKDVAQLYQKKNEFIRKHPGKELPEDLTKLERDLFKAQTEGRLR